MPLNILRKTVNNLGNNTNKRPKFYLYIILLVTALSLYTIGCADDPSNLGLNFIPNGETTGVRIFDSYIDTMPITSQNVRYYVNNSSSQNFMVGKNGSYDAKGLIKFGGFGTEYDSATVNSAVMTLSYRNYYFPTSSSDSLGQVSFDVYKILSNLNFTTITLDSVYSTTFGTTQQGSFTGSPTADSQEVSFNLNTSMVKDWLEYSADTNYANKNYGIALTPNTNSNVIKAFYSGLQGIAESVLPTLTIILTKNGDTDTITTRASATLSLVNTVFAPNNESFYLQAGVSYSQVMKFDMSRFPANSTINDVQLYFTLDGANSKFSRQTSYNIDINYISDTVGYKSTDIVPFSGSSVGNNKYMIRLVSAIQASPFQRWQLGQANYGIFIRARNQTVNLDLFSFFKETASVDSTRPRVVIKYTPRINP